MRRTAVVITLLAFPSCGTGGGASSGAIDVGTDGGFASFFGDSSAVTNGAGPWYDRTPQPVPADWPPILAQARLAYDEARQHVLLFGGGVVLGFSKNNDLFEWNGDGGVWTKLTPSPLPAAWPPARGGQAMAYDSKRHKLLVFGGYDYATDPLFLNARNDLWELDSTTLTWTDRTPSPLPSAWPPARWMPRMVYDSARDRMVLFGGYVMSGSNDVFDDLWEWDGTAGSWTDRTPTPRPTAWPPGRALHDMVYDSTRGRTVIFAGYPDGEYLNDLWEWDGTSFVDRTPSPLPANWPSPRTEYALAYDSVRARMILFGGYVPINGETWEWDGAGNEWTLMPPTGPSPRRGPAMAFDGQRRVTVLFGGEDVELAPSLHDTWEYGTPPRMGIDGGTR